MTNGGAVTEVPAGLEGVVVAHTAISDVDGTAGRLTYRGRDIEEVVSGFAWEDLVPWLAGERATALHGPAARDIDGPMAAMVRVVLDEGRDVNSDDWQDAYAFIRRVPPAVASALVGARRSDGDEEGLTIAGRYLARLTGRRPTALEAAALNAYWVMAAEHSLNASTFAVRIAASTGAGLPLALAAGVAVLAGPLHGGAPTDVLDLLDEARRHPDDLAAWIDAKLDRRERLPGFGHRVYRALDPRARALKTWYAQLAREREAVAFAARVEEAVLRALRARHPERVLATNVEYYAGVVLDALGIPRMWCPPTFACARLAGWTAHYYEQRRQNRLIRPLARYDPDPAP